MRYGIRNTGIPRYGLLLAYVMTKSDKTPKSLAKPTMSLHDGAKTTMAGSLPVPGRAMCRVWTPFPARINIAVNDTPYATVTRMLGGAYPSSPPLSRRG